MFFIKFILFLFLWNSVNAFKSKCVCGREAIKSRIIGGIVAQQSKFPWIAYIFVYKERGGSQCGGALINNNYILTAAHCFPDVPTADIIVSLGQTNLSKALKRLEVDKVIIHPLYDARSVKNDIALVRLKKPVEFNSYIQPVCLPPKNMLKFGNLTISGWGRTESGKTSKLLMEITTSEYDFDKCNSELGYSLDKNSQFCAGDIGKSSCSGDSGGPVTFKVNGRSFLVGAVSFRVGECGKARTTVRTRITHYLNWIKENTRDAKYCK